MADWILQGNPKHYDVGAALDQLDEISWRVPQHTGEIGVGDRVFIWQAGNDAGIVGIGTVSSPPRLGSVPDAERRFVLSEDLEGAAETRVSVRVRRTRLVPKAEVAAAPALAAHRVVTAPMGTVFALSEDEGLELAGLVALDFPEVRAEDDLPWPSVFSWKDRRKDVYPMPGGYDQQIESLSILMQMASERRRTMEEFGSAIRERFGSSESNARHITLFLRRMGFLNEEAGLLEPSLVGASLLDERDDALLLAHLHQRARFIGEMLDVVSEPCTPDEVLHMANEHYGMGWTTKAQIQRRRGWLQSLGALRVDEDGLLALTVAGHAALARLELHGSTVLRPSESPPSSAAVDDDEIGTEERTQVELTDEVQLLVDELLASATDSTDPDRFEHAVAATFTFLGFRAVKLGGAGRTDVVADADLGRDDSYRVIIDGKTTSRDAVGDHQIDWDTIDEHRAQHEADYAVIAGPGFGGPRVSTRAREHNTLLATASDLAELVQQHADCPLGLDAYRGLFAGKAGEVDLEDLTESVEESQRFVQIAVAVLEQVEANVSEVGALSARDMFLLLRGEADLEASEAEIQAALDALASPLVGALARSGNNFRPAGRRESTIRRLRRLSELLA